MKVFTEKIEFYVDPNIETILFNNCDYRLWLYNKCVDIIKDDQEKNNTHYFNISEYKLLSIIRHDYEFNNHMRNAYNLYDYDYYFRGISECVVKDVIKTCSLIITRRKQHKFSDIRYSEFNKNNR